MKLVHIEIDKSKLENVVVDFLDFLDENLDLSSGGWLAGGFPRMLGHHLFIKKKENDDWCKYFRITNVLLENHFVDTLKHCVSQGDVDIFSPPHQTIDKVIKIQDVKKYTQPSYGRFAKNSEGFCKFRGSYLGDPDSCDKELNKHFIQSIKFQFIDDQKMRYDTIEECFDSFDFVNCRYSLYKDCKNDWILVYDPRAIHADLQKKIEIHKNVSPFLGSRIIKYHVFRGCENGLTESSKVLLSEWYLKIICEDWDVDILPNHLRGIPKNLDNLFKLGFLEIEQLPPFLGKWTVSVQDMDSPLYGKTKVVDWAKNSIESFDDVKKSCK